MNSDVDILTCKHSTNIMSDWADWEAGRQNALMVKEETTPPQHYWLQFIKPDSPEPYRYIGQKLINCLAHVDRRVFISNKVFLNSVKPHFGDDLICCGPSTSFDEMIDIVLAFKCKVVPPEVYRWFHRPRRGHWPTPEMMQAASECSCFLIPDGHFESLNNNIEWRISPSQIERILVFNFTIVQLKCYVVLKMIKKHIMEHYLSHNSKLTSFHCKTVMFFTLERVSPAEWREDRLIECIGYCLQTLQMFLIRGHLPHYIIPESNLFEGKITRRYQLVLLEKIKEFLKKHELELTPEILYLYERSLDTDVASSRLKLASTFYCRGDSHRAADVLNDVERRYGNNVHAVCQCGRRTYKPDDLLIESTTDDWNYDTVIRKVALCVTFKDSDIFCVPPILLYEMNRAVNDDAQHRTREERFWMDMAAVDSRPFLFYLQYLTYRELGLRTRQLLAHNNLKTCLNNQDIVRTMYHPETACNLLGHCSEMEGNPLQALNLYIHSVQNVPRNNAANWHIRRLTGHL
ncbi:uncharacterized protein LOC128226054 [Mya arenaria]|uniref:uncharacterized protein LOC128226054 n=1 Tax=Mya arenaria TaxID=6604 RepID=UPI0022E57AB6|nr:uncharacterized protein LOC128226054 [Mya arenaria]